jgi:hypothetical protein
VAHVTTVKTCFKCGVSKELKWFYRHPAMKDGRLGKCIDCTKKDVAENYEARRAHYAAYERKRYQRPESKAYQQKKTRAHNLLNPDKYKARNAVSNAIRDGRLMKQDCEVCGEKAQAHHEDYSRPLDVRWLCRKHHLAEHDKQAY